MFNILHNLLHTKEGRKKKLTSSHRGTFGESKQRGPPWLFPPPCLPTHTPMDPPSSKMETDLRCRCWLGPLTGSSGVVWWLGPGGARGRWRGQPFLFHYPSAAGSSAGPIWGPGYTWQGALKSTEVAGGGTQHYRGRRQRNREENGDKGWAQQ